ncbi:MAG TPA: cupin domain-containing protein [Trebonia sp.]|nr:cupin domain-containing protein [Trebonia sp.]
MLRVSKVDARPNRPRGAEPARQRPRPERTRDGCLIVRSGPHGAGAQPAAPSAPVPPGGHENGRRSGGDQQPGVSGPSSGAQALRLHLVMLPPGTRGTPHLHPGHETAVYLVSGEAELWHGPGLGERSAVRPGDFVYLPPGTEHLAVNRGGVTAIAVVARAGDGGADGDRAAPVVVQLPQHLADAAGIPVAAGP